MWGFNCQSEFAISLEVSVGLLSDTLILKSHNLLPWRETKSEWLNIIGVIVKLKLISLCSVSLKKNLSRAISP